MSSIQFRIARDSNLFDIIDRWWSLIGSQKEAKESVPLTYYNKIKVEKMIRNRILSGEIILALKSESIVGMASIRKQSVKLDGLIPTWVLSDMWVDCNYRRDGIGSGLVSFCEGLIRKSGGERLWLNVHQANPTAREFYNSLGYSIQSLRMEKIFSPEI